MYDVHASTRTKNPELLNSLSFRSFASYSCSSRDCLGPWCIPFESASLMHKCRSWTLSSMPWIPALDLGIWGAGSFRNRCGGSATLPLSFCRIREIFRVVAGDSSMLPEGPFHPHPSSKQYRPMSLLRRKSAGEHPECVMQDTFTKSLQRSGALAPKLSPSLIVLSQT
jgi:hypothetical protein